MNHLRRSVEADFLCQLYANHWRQIRYSDKIYGTQGALDRQGDDGLEREGLLSHPLGVFTTVLSGCPNA